jgi:hypothetical protein
MWFVGHAATFGFQKKSLTWVNHNVLANVVKCGLSVTATFGFQKKSLTWVNHNVLANVVKCGLSVTVTFGFQKKSRKKKKNPIFKEMTLVKSSMFKNLSSKESQSLLW